MKDFVTIRNGVYSKHKAFIYTFYDAAHTIIIKCSTNLTDEINNTCIHL